jgi:hypothetical protein
MRANAFMIDLPTFAVVVSKMAASRRSKSRDRHLCAPGGQRRQEHHNVGLKAELGLLTPSREGLSSTLRKLSRLCELLGYALSLSCFFGKLGPQEEGGDLVCPDCRTEQVTLRLGASLGFDQFQLFFRFHPFGGCSKPQ